MSVGSTEARAQMTAADIDAVYRVVDDARRNFLITDAYHRLSTDMKRLIGPHGSWCTFSTWSSRTIGYFIRGDIDPVTEHWLAGLPAWIRFVVRRPVLHLNRLISRSRHRAGPRLLARGNREIFLEIAGEFTRFIDEFATAPTRDDRHWRTYRATITASPTSELFPEADVELMRNGFGAYYAAIHEPDVRKQAELVLLGNILLADYEQQRVDPIVRSALSLFPSRLLNDDPADPELLTVRDKKPWALQDKGRVRTWIDATYARLVTRFRMAIVLPAGRPLRAHSELICVGVGLPKPPAGDALYASRLALLRNRELVAVWNAHDRARGAYRAAKARNWTELGDRMNCIVNVFRARQEREALYEIEPLTAAERRVAQGLPPECS